MSKSTNTWYAIRRRTALAAAAIGVAAAAEIYIYGDIGESWWEETVSAAAFVRDLNALDVDAITVRINSMGGSVPDGLAIFNAMRRHKATITTEVDGMAFSIASLIAMGGDKVHMADNAMLMIHAPWTYAAGNSAQLRELAEQLDTWAVAMSTSYAARTGDQPAMLALLTDGKDHYYTAAEAVDLKLVDAVTDPMPVAASLRDMPLNRYRSLPASLASGITAAAAAPSPQEQSTMTTATTSAATPTTAAPAAPTASPVSAVAILAAESARRAGIRATFLSFAATAGVPGLQSACEDDTSCTVEAAGSKLLAHLGKDMTPAVNGRVQTVEDETDKFRGAVEQSLLARAGVRTADGPIVVARDNPFRAAKLSDIARECLVRSGVKPGYDAMQIVGQAFTQGTGDFPILLENVLHRTLQAAYAIQPDTWSRFCKKGSVSDFRAHNRYRVGSLSNLERVNELGEFKNKTIPDGEKSSIKADTKGNIINVSRQLIVNDDMDAFTGLADALGRAARRTVEADVYTLLGLNGGMGPLLDDGKALFHVDHGNLIATGANAAGPSVVVFDAMRQLLGQQKDVSGNDFLQLNPAIWLGPLSMGGAARVVNGSEYDPDAANKLQRANISRGLVKDIVDTPRLSGTAHYMFADPSSAPVLEVVFLNGDDVPFLDRQEGWEVDGSAFKVRLDFGVGAVDYRGAVANDGTP